MTARTLITILLVCILMATGLGHALLPVADAQTRPNFVVIILDDLDAASVTHMPAVNRLLVEQGATFSNAFASTPLCCPSRASILRGQYAHNHGVLRNTGEDAGFAAFVQSGHERVTLATELTNAGYQTALVGKYLNGYTDRDDQTYVPPGWSYWAAGVDHAAYDGFNYDLNVNGELVRHGHDDDDYMTDVLTGHAREFLSAAASSGDPFLLYLAPYAPHSPSTPAPRHRGQFAGAEAPRTPAFNERDIKDKPAWVRSTPRMSEARIERIDADYRRRLESLLAVDEMVETVVRQLEQSGTLQSTYIVFLSDNGYFMGEHRQPHGKDAPYDAASRIPLVVRGPGVPANSRVDALALNIDLMPTILDLAGSGLPSFVDGRSLAPTWTGNGGGQRKTALLEGFGKETENLEGNESSTPLFRALRGKETLYVEYDTGERELYNLRKDPFQLANLAKGADKAVLRAFSRQLKNLASCAGLACQVAEDTGPPRATGRSGGKPRDAGNERNQGERKRTRTSAPPRAAPVAPTVEIAESETVDPSFPISLSRQEAQSGHLRLRVHVAAVEAPGTLVASVELPASGGRERLTSVPIRDPGWVALDIAAALGDTREIVVSLSGRDGAILTLSAPGSTNAPELVSESPGRVSDNGRASGRDKRAVAISSPDRDSGRKKRTERAPGR